MFVGPLSSLLWWGPGKHLVKERCTGRARHRPASGGQRAPQTPFFSLHGVETALKAVRSTPGRVPMSWPAVDK